jgi:hypothetical protein
VSEEDDQPLVFQLLFTIPRMASAYARHPDGGARMKLDIDESTVAAANAMLDLMVKRPATIFAAAIVVVKEPETCTKLYDTDEYATSEDPKREAPVVDKRRTRKRRD